MRQTRGWGCNAGRALSRAGREHARRAAHSRWLGPQGGEKELVPSPARTRAATAPALLVFWNLPHAGARGRMGGEERGRGGGGHALGSGSATRKARGRRSFHQQPGEGHRLGHRGRRILPASPDPAPRPSLRSRPRHLTWVAFPHRLGGEEERALLDERVVEAVELPVHGGGGEWKWRWGEKAASRQVRNALAKHRVLVSSSGRRGANEAAGSAAYYLYTAPARARLGPRPSAPRANAPLARGRGRGRGGAPRGVRPNHSARQGEGSGGNAPLSRIFAILSTNKEWGERQYTGSLYASVFDVGGRETRALWACSPVLWQWHLPSDRWPGYLAARSRPPAGAAGIVGGFVLWLSPRVFPAALPGDARVTGSQWPTATWKWPSWLVSVRSFARPCASSPWAQPAAGSPAGGRLVAGNFLVNGSVVKMAEKRNKESSVIDFNDCRPPSAPSATVSERGPHSLWTLRWRPRSAPWLQPFPQERRQLTRLTLHLLTLLSWRRKKVDV